MAYDPDHSNQLSNLHRNANITGTISQSMTSIDSDGSLRLVSRGVKASIA